LIPNVDCLIYLSLRSLFSLDPPTSELVQKVKELYHKRVSDVRFLIPVLNGLLKHEIVDVLPKLITQSPNVVKEVFNRLLGSFQSRGSDDHLHSLLYVQCNDHILKTQKF